MAAVHHPQIDREESGLCGCELNSSFSVFCFIFWLNILSLLIGILYVAGPAYCLWRWRHQVPQRHRHPHVHLQHLHGWQVRTYLCANVSHHVTNRCIFTYPTATESLVTLWRSFPSCLCFFFFFSLLVPGASTTQMETFWLVRKRAVDVFTVVYHKNTDSSIPSPYSPSDFLFSLFCFPL